MLISYTSNGSVQLKTRTQPIVIGAGVQIGDRAIPGPGEYDIANIQCEGVALSNSVTYFLRDEDLLITYLQNLDQDATKLDQISDTAVLILDVRSDDTAAVAKAIIKSIEPAYVFLIGAGAHVGFWAELGIPLAETSSLKVTRTGLPLEGTSLVVNQ